MVSCSRSQNQDVPDWWSWALFIHLLMVLNLETEKLTISLHSFYLKTKHQTKAEKKPNKSIKKSTKQITSTNKNPPPQQNENKPKEHTPKP